MINPRDHHDSDPLETPLDLSPDDRRLLDILIEHGFDPESLEHLPASDRARCATMMSLFRTLEDYPVEDSDVALVHATLARIDRYEAEHVAVMQLPQVDEVDAMPRRLFRLPDFLSVAAVLLIAASIAIPLLSSFRQSSIDSSCQANLRLLGTAFTLYAGDYDNAMPVSTAGIGGAFSWDTARNHDNLAPLCEHGYCEETCLDCGGHHNQGPSYSYQLQVPAVRTVWEGPVSVVLGDRNPLVDAARLGSVQQPLTVSLNHRGRGQNVLRNDGTVIWLEIPKFNQDNIWLPSGVLSLEKGDVHHEAADVFLTH